MEGLKRAIPIDHLCTACITGEYPIPMDEGILKRMGEKRKKE